MQTVKRISLALIIIGAINWGLIGLFQFDLVAALFGGQNAVISRIVYTLVGIGGVLCIPSLFEPADEDYDFSELPERQNYAAEFGDENDPLRDDEEK